MEVETQMEEGEEEKEEGEQKGEEEDYYRLHTIYLLNDSGTCIQKEGWENIGIKWWECKYESAGPRVSEVGRCTVAGVRLNNTNPRRVT